MLLSPPRSVAHDRPERTGEPGVGRDRIGGCFHQIVLVVPIGLEPGAGRAVEYSDLPLPSGKILRVASAEVVMPDSQPLFPGGLKPDLPVEMLVTDKRQIFTQSEKGMSQFVYETERPHLNEAAVLAGTNPELDVAEAQRRIRAREKPPLRDSVLQRALDVVTSLEIYQKR